MQGHALRLPIKDRNYNIFIYYKYITFNIKINNTNLKFLQLDGRTLCAPTMDYNIFIININV